MDAYSLMLFLHFVFLIGAVAATALAGFAALRLRSVETAAEVMHWGAMLRRVTPTFPVASLGLIGTGAYMTSKVWAWSTPWILAGLAGLIAIMLLGAGVEGSRARAIRTELRAGGLSQRARRLLRDPVAWSAKVTTWTLVLAVMFVMTAKPTAVICAVALVLALVCGVLGAVPFWAAPRTTEHSPAHAASVTRNSHVSLTDRGGS